MNWLSTRKLYAGFTPALYGFGAGIFFLAYTMCELPSNMMLARYGAWQFYFAAATPHKERHSHSVCVCCVQGGPGGCLVFW